MPDLNGPGLISEVKEVNDDIIIILLTGYSNLVSEENVGKFNVEGILAKPYDIDSINQLIHKASKNKYRKWS